MIERERGLYWRDDKGRMNCRHGAFLYGDSCVQCERESPIIDVQPVTEEQRSQRMSPTIRVFLPTGRETEK